MIWISHYVPGRLRPRELDDTRLVRVNPSIGLTRKNVLDAIKMFDNDERYK